jgi:small-conductance mechanosensitive channel
MDWEQVWNVIVTEVTPYLENIATAAVGLILTAAVYFALTRGLSMLVKRGKLSQGVVDIARRLLRWATVVAVIVLLMHAFGVLKNAWTAITAVLAMIAIGFVAVWSVLSNTLCSVILMLVRPFRIGDTIEFPPDPLRGKVINFTMLFTILRDEEKDELIQVPNNIFFQRVIRRKKGDAQIRLDDQVLERKDAKV